MRNNELENKTVEDIKNILCNTKFVIYGAGSVGKRLLKIIERMNIRKNLIGFAVTENKETHYMEGIPIKKIDEYDKNTLVLIAVHDVIYIEIKEVLQNKGYKHFLWVYPYFSDLCYGPIVDSDSYPTKDIISNLDKVYSHVLIALVIEECLGQNNVGVDIYRQYFESFCDKKTANARTKSLIDRINKASGNGFNLNTNIETSKDMKVVLDGAHRLMLTHYFGNKNILVNIREAECDEYYKLVDFALTKNKLSQLFNPSQVKQILDMDDRLRKGYEITRNICSL